MDEGRLEPHEPVSIVVPVRVIGGNGGARRGRTALVVWAVALVVIVGVAIAGRPVVGGEAAPRSAAIAFAAPSDAPAPELTAPPADGVPAPELIVLANPVEAGMTITTRELVVQGYLRVAAETIRVTLEARGNRVIDDATITPALAVAERPTLNRHPQFQVHFGLPNPRPNGRMIVQVAAYDRDGQIIDVIRRPFQVGPLLEGAGA